MIKREAVPPNIEELASRLEHARAHNYQIPPLSASIPDLDQGKGYQIAATIRRLREKNNNEIVAGRKIGFTNRSIWPEYGIDASNWSYMYRNSIVKLADIDQSTVTGSAEVEIGHLSSLEPRIEPEIVLGVSKPVRSSMNDEELLSCIEWIAHGFEVVASIFPRWKFTAADTTAAFALHALLLVGPETPVQKLAQPSLEHLLNELAGFKVDLFRNGEIVDEGKGSNVLGSPIKALRHLAELLEQDEFNDPLAAGEIVTTGTLTRALPINHKDIWSTTINGIGLPGLQVQFNLG